MNKDGSNVVQLTFGSKYGIRRSPKHFNKTLFYWDAHLYSTAVTGYAPKEITGSREMYVISSGGEIVYVSTRFAITDPRWATLWVLDSGLAHSTQLTYNHN